MADKQVNIIVKAVDAVTGELRKIGDGVDSFASKIKGVFVAIAAAIAALGIGKLFKDSIAEFLEAEKSIARLDAALRPLGGSYKAVGAEVEKYLTNLQRTTRYSDEDGREALSRLIVATGNYRQSLKDMQVVIDLASFKQITLSEAANIVAKAHIGVGRELKTMNIEVKAGVDAVPQLTERLKDHEKISRTMGDRLGMVNNLWAEFKERLGAALLGGKEFGGGMDRIIDILVRAANWIDTNSEKIGTFADFLIRFVSDAGSTVFGFLGKLKGAWDDFAAFNQRLVASVVGAVGQMVFGFATAVEVIGGPLLKLFGVTVVDGMKAKGEEMVRNSKSALALIGSEYTFGYGRLGGTVKEGEETNTGIVGANWVRRGGMTTQALAEQKKSHEAFYKAVEAAEKESYKIRKELMSEAQRAFIEASTALWDKLSDLQKAALEAGMEDSDKYTEALGHIQEALERVTRTWAAAEIPAEELTDEFKNQGGATQSLTVDLDALIGETEEEQVAAINSTEEKRRQKQSFKDFAREVAETGGEIAGFAGKLRDWLWTAKLINPEIDQLIGGIEGIGRGIAMITTDPLGAAGTIIGGLKSVVNLFTGESESSRRVRIALEQAREAIQHNTRALGDLGETDTAGRVVAGIKSGLESFFASFQRSTMTPYLTASQESQLSGALSARGVSLADLESLARDYGVTLRPQGKGIHAGILAEFLKLVGGLDTGIPTDFGSQLRQIQDTARLRGDSPQQLLDAILGLVTGPYGSPFLASAFAGKSPQQILSALPGIAQNRGAVGAAGLGGLNLAQFDQVINLLADTIRSIAAPAGGVPALPPLPTPTLPPMGNPLGGISFMPNAPVLLPAPVGNTSVQSTIASLTVNVVPSEWNVEDIAQTVGTSVGTVLAAQAAAIDQILANNYRSSAQSRGNVTLT